MYCSVAGRKNNTCTCTSANAAGVFPSMPLALIVGMHVHNINILAGCITCMHLYIYAVHMYAMCLHSGSYMCMYISFGEFIRMLL